MESNDNPPPDAVGQYHDVASANFSAPVFPELDCSPISKISNEVSISSVSQESLLCDPPLIIPVHMPPPPVVMNVPPPGFPLCNADNTTQVPAQFTLPVNAFVQQPDPCFPFVPFFQMLPPDPSVLPGQNAEDVAAWKRIADRFICDNMEKTTTKVLNLTSTNKSHKPHKRRRSREKKRRSRTRSRSRMSRSTSRSKHVRSRSRGRERIRRSRSHSSCQRAAQRKKVSRDRSRTYVRKRRSRSSEKIREVPTRGINNNQSPKRTAKSAKSSKKTNSLKRSRNSSTDSTSSSSSSTSNSSSSTSSSSDSTVDLTVKTKSSRTLRTNKKPSAHVSTKIRLKLGMKKSPMRPVSSPKPDKGQAAYKNFDSDSDSSSSPKSKRRGKKSTKKSENVNPVLIGKADETRPIEVVHEKVQPNPETSDLLLGTRSSGREEDEEVIVISHICVSAGNKKPASPCPCEPAVQELASSENTGIPFELGFEDHFGVAWSEDQFSDFFCTDLVLGREDMQYPYWPLWCLDAICCPRYYCQIVA